MNGSFEAPVALRALACTCVRTPSVRSEMPLQQIVILQLGLMVCMGSGFAAVGVSFLSFVVPDDGDDGPGAAVYETPSPPPVQPVVLTARLHPACWWRGPRYCGWLDTAAARNGTVTVRWAEKRATSRRPSRGPSPITLACTLGPAPCPSPRALGSLLHGSPSHLLALAGSLWGCWIWIQACSGGCKVPHTTCWPE